jgi:hypothetical protein
VGVPAPVLAPIISEAVNVTYLVGRDAAVGDQSLQVLGGCPVNIQLDRHFTIFIHLSLARTGIELTDSGTPLTSAPVAPERLTRRDHQAIPCLHLYPDLPRLNFPPVPHLAYSPAQQSLFSKVPVPIRVEHARMKVKQGQRVMKTSLLEMRGLVSAFMSVLTY